MGDLLVGNTLIGWATVLVPIWLGKQRTSAIHACVSFDLGQMLLSAVRYRMEISSVPGLMYWISCSRPDVFDESDEIEVLCPYPNGSQDGRK